MDDPSPAMKVIGKHATYDVEEQYAIVLERFKCHLTEDQGLVWTGLPAKSDIQWEPQTTVIKVTLDIILLFLDCFTWMKTSSLLLGCGFHLLKSSGVEGEFCCEHFFSLLFQYYRRI